MKDYLNEYLNGNIKWENNASTKTIQYLKKTDNVVWIEDETEFPDIADNEFFLITIEHPFTKKYEICYVYKKEKRKLWVKRGYEETEPMDFPPGCHIENRITKGTLELLYLKSHSSSSFPSFYPTFIGTPNQLLKVSKDGVKLEFFNFAFLFEYKLNDIKTINSNLPDNLTIEDVISSKNTDYLKQEFFIRHNLFTDKITYTLYDIGLDLNLENPMSMLDKNNKQAVIPENFEILNNNTIYLKVNPILINGILDIVANTMASNFDIVEKIECLTTSLSNKLSFKNSGTDKGGLILTKDYCYLEDEDGNKQYDFTLNINSSFLTIAKDETVEINVDLPSLDKSKNWVFVITDLSLNQFKIPIE